MDPAKTILQLNNLSRFQVNVQFCVDECNPVECEDGIQSYGRRKRDLNSSEPVPPPTTPFPEPYASRLVFDPNLGQEVLTVDTPLSKEIIVDSGAKVDSFRTPRYEPEPGPGGGGLKNNNDNNNNNYSYNICCPSPDLFEREN